MRRAESRRFEPRPSSAGAIRPRAGGGLTAVILLGVALVAGPAQADIYRCVKNGVETFANDKKVAEQRRAGARCTLYMKGSKASRSSRGGGGSSGTPRVGRSSRGSLPPTPRGTEAPRGPDGALPYDALVREAATEFDLPAALVHAVIHVESRYRPDALSRAGAQGLMQLMPATAERMGVRDPYDERDNIFGGARYLRRLTNYFDGDVIKVLAAYHAGHRAVVESDGIPYAATERYVKSVLGRYFKLQASLGAAREGAGSADLDDHGGD